MPKYSLPSQQSYHALDAHHGSGERFWHHSCRVLGSKPSIGCITLNPITSNWPSMATLEAYPDCLAARNFPLIALHHTNQCFWSMAGAEARLPSLLSYPDMPCSHSTPMRIKITAREGDCGSIRQHLSAGHSNPCLGPLEVLASGIFLTPLSFYQA